MFTRARKMMTMALLLLDSGSSSESELDKSNMPEIDKLLNDYGRFIITFSHYFDEYFPSLL